MTACRRNAKATLALLAFLIGDACALEKTTAAESWADAQLPVRDGLVAWFDAGRQNAARESVQLAPVAPNITINFLLDGSGRGHHLHQPVSSARPVFRQSASHAWLSFDGQDDFLPGANWDESLTNATVFIVAAPRSNSGFFRALFSFNRRGRNDYQSGLNFDLGGRNSANFNTLNVEGPGFGGERNLLASPLPFGTWHVFALAIGSGTNGLKLFVDGHPHGIRERTGRSILRADQFRLGAREYDNSGSFPATTSFFDGEIAEILVFNHELKNTDRISVGNYLASKHAGIGDGPRTAPLVAVTNGPPVQWLVPGFEVRELPVSLRIVNFLRYRPDGQLCAGGYDGSVWLLRDTDGDGLEDRVTPFWTNRTIRAPIGAAITPPGYPRGDGLFLPNIHKLSLVIDTNRDGRADEEIVCASWSDNSDQSNVDALGCALDRDGNA